MAGTPDVGLTEEQSAQIAMLRTKGLSIRGLDAERREALRRTMVELHVERGVSLGDIAKLIGNKTSGYTSWLCAQLGVKARPFEEARLKGIREKRRKYERRPFDGSEEDKAYLLGVAHGDFHTSSPWNGAVRVSLSTTHPAMAELFHELFDRHGHVYEYPRYKKDTRTYEWNFTAILDSSFEFLTEEVSATWGWISGARGRILGYLAGLLDAEGSIGLYRSGRATSLVVSYYNTNREMMDFLFHSLVGLGCHPLPPYLDKPAGFRTPGFKIEMKHDYYRVLVASFDEAQFYLSILPLRHREKRAKAEIALTLSHRQSWQSVVGRVVALRDEIRRERDMYVRQAKEAVEDRLTKRTRSLALSEAASKAE